MMLVRFALTVVGVWLVLLLVAFLAPSALSYDSVFALLVSAFSLQVAAGVLVLLWNIVTSRTRFVSAGGHALGWIAIRFGVPARPPAAPRVRGRRAHRQAVVLCREIGDRLGEAYALGNLGFVYLRLARYPEAVDHLGQTLAISLELGDRFGEGHALTALGMTHAALGRYAEAIEYHQRGLGGRRSPDSTSSARPRWNRSGALDRPAPGTATVSGSRRAGRPGTESGDVVLKG